jgi:hypothetical protein
MTAGSLAMSRDAIDSSEGRTRRLGPSIDPRVDPEAWVMNNQRITNEANLEDWLALYAPDAVFDSIADGAADRFEGIAAITEAARALIVVFKKYRLQVHKRFVCATEERVVNSWTGGFEGRDRQFGTEIWSLRDGLVVRHEQYTFLDVRPSSSARARITALLGSERKIMFAVGRETARLRRFAARS